MPEIPKKKLPEEKRPVPRREEEVPPPKGIVSLSLSPRTIFTILCSQAKDDFVSSVIRVHRECVSMFCVELQWHNIEVLKVDHVFKVPAVPKKPIPEEKVPVPVPVAKKAPPPRGRICFKYFLTKIFEPVHSFSYLMSSCADALSLFG